MNHKTIYVNSNINTLDLQYYVNNGILPEGELDDNEVDVVSLICLFSKIGLDKGSIVEYLSLSNDDYAKKNKSRILRSLRGKILDLIHDKQKQLDNLDYIIYELEHKK